VNLNGPVEKDHLNKRAIATLELATVNVNNAGPKIETSKLEGLSPRHDTRQDATKDFLRRSG
jgi:hypothetical protein